MTTLVPAAPEHDDRVQRVVAARSFKPLSAAETAALLARTEQAARNGEFEGYKTTNNFDGTAHNPQWLG